MEVEGGSKEKSRASSSSSSSSSTSWVQFPLLSQAGKSLMEELAKSIEKELGPQLHPSKTPSNVTHFANSKGNAQGSVVLRSGLNPDKIRFLLGSWLHCKLVSGTLNIATLIIMLGPDTDAPHFMFEFIQNDANSVIMLLDLLPRKDVVMDPDYLRRFYEDTELEKLRQGLEHIPQSKPYISTSLYVRSVVSPTALMFKFKGLQQSSKGSSTTNELMEELDILIKEIIKPTAKKALFIWMDAFCNRGKISDNSEERKLMALRDEQIKSKGVEIDLSSNMPKLFGKEITERVIAAYRKGE